LEFVDVFSDGGVYTILTFRQMENLGGEFWRIIIMFYYAMLAATQNISNTIYEIRRKKVEGTPPLPPFPSPYKRAPSIQLGSLEERGTNNNT